MPKYAAYGVVQGTKYLGEFEAKSKEEAEDKALKSEFAHVSLCSYCISQCEDPEVTDVNLEKIEE